MDPDQLIAIFTDLEARLSAGIARRLESGIGESSWQAEKLGAISAFRRWVEALTGGTISAARKEAVMTLVRAWMSGELAAELVAGAPEGAAAARAAAEALTLAHAREVLTGLPRLAKVVDALDGRLAGLALPILRWSEDAYRSVIATAALPGVLMGTQTRRQASVVAWSRLLDRGITGFVDRGGRSWNLAGYVEMATRTGVMQASREGHVSRLGDLGVPLGVISDAPQECSRCRPWEGKIVTLKGPSGRQSITVPRATDSRQLISVEVAGSLDEAKADGLFHPNCRHTVSAYLPGVTRPATNTEDPAGDRARQHLRSLERQARRAKIQQAAAIDDDQRKKAGQRLRAIQAKIRNHVRENSDLGIRRKPEREAVDLGFRRG